MPTDWIDLPIVSVGGWLAVIVIVGFMMMRGLLLPKSIVDTWLGLKDEIIAVKDRQIAIQHETIRLAQESIGKSSEQVDALLVANRTTNELIRSIEKRIENGYGGGR